MTPAETILALCCAEDPHARAVAHDIAQEHELCLPICGSLSDDAHASGGIGGRAADGLIDYGDGDCGDGAGGGSVRYAEGGGAPDGDGGDEVASWLDADHRAQYLPAAIMDASHEPTGDGYGCGDGNRFGGGPLGSSGA